MKIDFKQPRYMIPLILLPFICLFFYIYKSSFGNEEPLAKKPDGLQDNVAEVSEQVKNRSLEDKLEAYRNRFKESDGYTAIGQIGLEEQASGEMTSVYNEREKRMLDSIDQSISRKYGRMNSPAASPGASYPETRHVKPTYGNNGSDRDLAEALNQMNQRQRTSASQTTVRQDRQADPMQIFRQQMALVDSMGKVNDPDYQQEQQLKKQHEARVAEERSQNRLAVTKANLSEREFNTILPDQKNELITAMIDQELTGYASSRLRIRLLDDMTAGKFLVKKGTYLFAQITGFSGQRVLLSISSIFQDGHVLPVKLLVYDNDGMPGLYVPSSAFREFSKELGSSAGQTNLQQQAEGNDQMVMSVLGKVFQSTSTAVTKLIRQNKAKLKYNTLVYLIDPDELKNKQSTY